VSDHPVPPQPADITSGDAEQIKQRLDELLDLFRRRLLDDKAKNALIDDLRRQLDAASLAPLYRELLHVVDRSTAPANDLAVSLGEEIIAVLERHGVTVAPTDAAFDPHIHRLAETRVSPLPAGQVVEVIRPGYCLGNLVLRPAIVVVSAAAPASPTPVELPPDPPAEFDPDD